MAISLSGARKRPLCKVGGVTAARASSFSVGSARRTNLFPTVSPGVPTNPPQCAHTNCIAAAQYPSLLIDTTRSRLNCVGTVAVPHGNKASLIYWLDPAVIRPHLTEWQARFRRWYEREGDKEADAAVAPQDIQRRYPRYEELKADMEKVNQRLMRYRKIMHIVVLGAE
jgi:hypothetical protein